ncbi:hypothetical protein D7Y21_35055 [Corallococcus sp. AB045]|uniref:KAP family P-loop NTPase fold protein n=1 Tax=Corallococcus sp. AB045 TaxID=2316719 RepID=UPI000EE5BE60|nr:P-loop NTPase fold protein [Corallococcus sp. AB045]RKH78802.1 hypothetical protein D7Y21_35055 [Corallococcus sp. AB045]
MSLGAFDPDRPISSAVNDLLGREGFARQAAVALARVTSEDPIVVGLYGPWGVGKTSIINLISAELKGMKDVVVVNFNPWFFSGEAELIERFFEELATAMGKKTVPARQQAASALKKYLKVLKPAAKIMSVASDLIIPGTGAIVRGVAEIATPAVDGAVAVAEPAAEMLNKDASLEDVRDEARDALVKAKVRVVVFVDDIDRLEPNDIRTVFKLVRLVGDLPWISYFLSFDPEVVAHSLSGGWGAQGKANKGREYLEKIIQVSLQVPPVRKADLLNIAMRGLERVLGELGVGVSTKEAGRLLDGWRLGVEVELVTIRQVKRVLSAVGFAVALLKYEVDVVDLILLEAMRVVYPGVMDAIRAEPYVVLKPGVDGPGNASRKSVGGRLEAALEELPNSSRSGVEKLLRILFPRFGSKSEYSAAFDVEWRKERRVASEEYLEKALSYGVPTGVVSDAKYNSMLRSLRRGENDSFVSMLNELVSGVGWRELVSRFRQDVDAMSSESAFLLASTVAVKAQELPQGDGLWGVSTFEEGARFCGEALWIGRDEKDLSSVSEYVIQKAGSLYFSALVLGWGIEKANVEKAERGSVSAGWISAVEASKSSFSKRASAELASSSVLGVWSRNEMLIVLRLWREVAGQGVVEVALRAWFASDPSAAERLVVLAIPPDEDIDNSYVWKIRARDGYSALAAIVSPVIIAKLLGEDADGAETELAKLSGVKQSRRAFLNFFKENQVGDA